MANFKLSDVRMGKNRCHSIKREGSRTWRCYLVVGHADDHVSVSGHRHWTTAQEFSNITD